MSGARPRNIVVGQRVDHVKLARSRDLRRQSTPAEHALWLALRGHRLRGPQFRRQQVIDGFIVDFYCHAAGLVVEVDGPVHEQQAGHDAERDRILAARGLRILRVSNDEVAGNLPGVLARIADECAGSTPGGPDQPT